MILLIDAGNTRIKLDCLHVGSGQRAGDVQAFTPAELNQLPCWLSTLPRRPVQALGVNVAGTAVAAQLESLLGDCPVEWVQAHATAGAVHNGYLQPGQLGADRWAALLGLAWHERRRRQTETTGPVSALLAIFGTATTIDTLRPVETAGLNAGHPGEAGTRPQADAFEFPGGLILPGPVMMRAALSTGTANLPQAEGDTVLYPTDTHQAIVTGVSAAQAGAVLRQWQAGLRHAGQPPEVYVSGGAVALVIDEVQRLLDETRSGLGLSVAPVRLLEAPVLDGLACLARAAPN